MIVGITGPISSGKGKVAEMFRDVGYVHHSFSSEIRQVAKERGIEVNRLNLEKLGGNLRKESPDSSILGGLVLGHIKKELGKSEKFVVEGIRDVEEVEMFRSDPSLKFVLVAVDGPQEERFERLRKRRRHGDPSTFKEFKEIDDRETEGGHGQDVGDCMKMADFAIVNDGSLDDLREKVDEIRKEIE